MYILTNAILHNKYTSYAPHKCINISITHILHIIYTYIHHIHSYIYNTHKQHPHTSSVSLNGAVSKLKYPPGAIDNIKPKSICNICPSLSINMLPIYIIYYKSYYILYVILYIIIYITIMSIFYI